MVLLPVLAACDGRQASSAVSGNGDANNREAVFAKVKDTTCFLAIERYFVEEIGSHYVHGEHCVPLQNIVAVDERDTDDILVWGDFWVFNYNQSGDTLKCVSGGSHPGLIHLRQTGRVFEVTAFDQVGDGSRFLPTAKRIFGDKYEPFMPSTATTRNEKDTGPQFWPTMSEDKASQSLCIRIMAGRQRK